MGCVPTVNELVVKVAVVTPPLVDSVPVPMVAPPSWKSTVPDGSAAALVPGRVMLTVAVNVTDWPYTEGFTDELTAVVVLALFTTWLTVLLVLVLKLLSPP